MFFRTFLTSCAIISAMAVVSAEGFAQTSSPSKYKVLSSDQTGLNINTVKSYLRAADDDLEKGDLDSAIETLKKARQVSNLLAGYYRDINGSFRGLNALIPREMNNKSRESVLLLAKTNLRLASIHRKRNEPELAVPLLVDVLKFMTPASPEGVSAYKALLELGFVDTPYTGLMKTLE